MLLDNLLVFEIDVSQLVAASSKDNPLFVDLHAHQNRLERAAIVFVQLAGCHVVHSHEFVVVQVIKYGTVAGCAYDLAFVGNLHLELLLEVLKVHETIGQGEFLVQHGVFSALALGIRIVVLQHHQLISAYLWEVEVAPCLEDWFEVVFTDLSQTKHLKNGFV